MTIMLQNKCYMVKGIVFLLYIGMNSGNGGYLYLLFCFKKKKLRFVSGLGVNLS